jgi:hypothetical protein
LPEDCSILDGQQLTLAEAVALRLERDRVLAHYIEAMAAAVRAGAFNAWCK